MGGVGGGDNNCQPFNNPLITHICGMMTTGMGLPVGRTGGGTKGGNMVPCRRAGQANPLKKGFLMRSAEGVVSSTGRLTGLGSRRERMISMPPVTWGGGGGE